VGRDEEDDPTDSDDPTEATRREGHASSKSTRVKKAPPPQGELTRGTLVGRYVLLDKLGEGGMGIVYGAFDPELDRKVAIKVLQAKEAGGSSGGDQAWLLREAQALARLAHPNVVAVHDVGTLPGDQVFVAMELVDGITMRQWLKAEVRTWRQLLPVLRAAGAGLAAAHGAGLVHRDFKPENVLVGHDGRVRVMDFGLARLHAGDDLSPSAMRVEGKSPLSADLTMAGHVVGTPAYMAPEIYDGSPADARTDQFAFGVTLFEGLYRARPFDKEELQPGRSAPPRPKIPSDASVPAALHRIAMRALSIDPAQRYASMKELLDQLSIDPTARRRRVLVALAGVTAAGAAIAGTVAIAGSSHKEVCKGIDRRLAGIWDAPAKKTVRDAFVATKLPFAPQAYASLEQALDAYTGEWVATAVESCEATRVRGDQTEDVLTLRSECLDRRLRELTSLVHLLGTPTRPLVEKGGKAATELEPVARCSNVPALREPLKPPPELQPKLNELTSQLADAKAELIVGNYIKGGATAAGAARLAREIGYWPGVAESEFVRATALMTTQSWDEAVKSYTSAAWAGMEGRRDDLVAHCAFSIATIEVQGISKPGEAQVWFDLGKAALKRLGTSDPGLAVRVLEVEGVVASMTGDHLRAVEAHRKALAEGERFFGHDNPLLYENEEIYAATLTSAFQYTEAIPHFEHAIELRARLVGPEHNDIALMLSNLGICYGHLRDPKARPTFEKAIAMREKLFGKNSPILVPSLDNFAEFLRHSGDIPEALSINERALKLAKAFPGVDHPTYHVVATDYAESLTAAGRYKEARALYDEVFALEAKTSSTTLPQTQVSRAELALVEHQYADAASYSERSVAGYEAAGGKDNPELWRPLSSLGRAKLALGKPASEVRPLLERAIAIGERIKLHELDLAATREALARLPPK
jgi:tetratricopeptide (TPR) repeat protein